MPARRILVLLAAINFACVCAFPVCGQDDSPSLGDVARQARLQKQQKDAQSKDAAASGKDAANPADQTKPDQGKPASGAIAASKNVPTKPSHVITNEEIPSHIGSTLTLAKDPHQPATLDPQPSSGDQGDAAQWKSQIQAQKAEIVALQSNLARLNDSIQYAGANCVSNCVQWNEEQKRKQDQVESMKAQLEQLQKQLEDLQESARKHGFGSSVYDPE
jgi:hypothetical protein